ncbi:hypothetical protein Hypma_004858, partial [Hypsizygus marmoreus]
MAHGKQAFHSMDWISQDKAYSDVPPFVKRAAKASFIIPASVHHDIIPAPTISIYQLAQFTLPTQIRALGQKQKLVDTDHTQFFCKKEPVSINENVLLRLRRLALPDTETAWLDGYKSVCYKHLSNCIETLFPLWVITFWNEVLNVRDIDWVLKQTRQTQFPERGALAEETILLLSVLPWGIRKPSGLSDGLEVHTLWRFLSDHWLSCSQQNDLLEMLRQKVIGDPKLAQKFCIKSVDLTTQLLAVFKDRPDNYQTSPNCAWLRQIGTDLAMRKSTLLTMAHLSDVTGEPHWVGVAMNLTRNAMLYADSMDLVIPTDLYAAYVWWMDQHVVLLESLKNYQSAIRTMHIHAES